MFLKLTLSWCYIFVFQKLFFLDVQQYKILTSSMSMWRSHVFLKRHKRHSKFVFYKIPSSFQEINTYFKTCEWYKKTLLHFCIFWGVWNFIFWKCDVLATPFSVFIKHGLLKREIQHYLRVIFLQIIFWSNFKTWI